MNRLEIFREIAVQSDHEGERLNAVRMASAEAGTSLATERAIASEARREAAYRQMARACPKLRDGLLELATDAAECREKTLMLGSPPR